MLTLTPQRLTLELGDRMDSASQAGLAVRQLRSLLPWLLRHSGGLRELRLTVDMTSTMMPGAPPQEGAEALSLLDACLAASGSAGGLQQLALSTVFPYSGREGHHDVYRVLTVGSWAAILTSLQCLTVRISGWCRLQLFVSLQRLTQLRSLRLNAASGLRCGPAVALPPSLTRLDLEGFYAPQAPVVIPQVGGH